MNEPKPLPTLPPNVDSVGSRYLRENIGPVLDFVANNHKPVVITRFGRPAVVMVPVGWFDLGDTPADTGLRDLPASNGRE